MDLNSIKLPPDLIAGLYTKTLVDIPVNKLKWLGNNEKNILVIVNDEAAVHIPDDELELLTTMLTACRLCLNDVVIINRFRNPEADYKGLTDHFRSRIILLFGLEPLAFGLPVSFPQFQVQNLSGKTFLFSPSLKELGQDKLVKSRLWLCLKRIFGV